MNMIITKLAGVSFGDCQENIRLFSYPSFSTYELQREADNPNDANAVRVGIDNVKLGYLPGPIAQIIGPMMDSGRTFIAEHVALNECPPHETVGLTVKIIETRK